MEQLRNYLISLFFLINTFGFSQTEIDPYVHVHGIITDYFTGVRLRNPTILLKENGIAVDSAISKNGDYSFGLPIGNTYLLEFSAKDRITKRLQIETQTIPEDSLTYYDMDLQVTLFKWIPNFDFSIFEKPIGIAKYQRSIRNMSWDNRYTQITMNLVEDAMDEYGKGEGGYYFRKSERLDSLQMSTEPSLVDLDNAINDTLIIDTLAKIDEPVDSVFITVQIGIYSKKLSPEQLAKFQIDQIYCEKLASGLFRYTSGKFQSISEAETWLFLCQLKVKDAFLVGTKGSKRITFEEAKEKLAK